MKIFFDTEFTGLHQKTTLISLGIISEDGKTFYAEFTDYDRGQVNDWIKDNVVGKLRLNDWNNDDNYHPYENDVTVLGSTIEVENALSHWLHQFESIEMWSDCLSYDWVLFCNIFGTAFDIPKNIYYIPFDICTLFKAKGIDADISREKFAHGEVLQEMMNQKHTALWDAKVIKSCYEKLTDPS